jgi:hypothetical protein
MQFTQISGAPMLYSGSATGLLLYLLPRSNSYPPAADPITFSDSWSKYAGWYIFLNAPLATTADQLAFAQAAWNFFSAPQMQGVRFGWFNPPYNTGLLTGTTLGVQSSGDNFITNADVTFRFSQITVFVTGGTQITPDLVNFAFVFTQTNAQPIYISANFGLVTIPATSNLTIPFTGNLAGCVQFASALSAQNLTDLDIGLRYFYAIPPDVQNPGVQVPNYQLGSLQYPVFNQNPQVYQAITLYANMDPLQALTAARTFLAFNGADAGQSGTAPAIPSTYTSILGDAFALLPQSGATLVFQVNQQANLQSAQDPYYLAPSGNYTMLCSRTPQVNLMCGLSGVEYVQLPNPTANAAGNVITFVPGTQAFAEGFYPDPTMPPGKLALYPASVPTTSFASVTTAATTLHYFAQPDQSVLYNYAGGPPPPVLSLNPIAVEAATLPAPGGTQVLFPMLPYSGLGGRNLDAYSLLEQQVANPARRLSIATTAKDPSLTAPPLNTPSATPQGLLVNYTVPFPDDTPAWQSVVLAQMDQLIAPPPKKAPYTQPAQLALSQVEGTLLQAFESNQLFLVISKPSTLQFVQNCSQIYIGADTGQQWTFDLTPGNWRSDTIVIVKFADLPLQSLAAQPSTWASPTTFNTNYNQTSSNIQSIINAAIASNDPDLANFINVVTEPTWNGVLILNATAPLTSLPSQLAGLAAGIKTQLFFGHHVGINASRLDVKNVAGPNDPPNYQLVIDNSSIFGLINYVVKPPGPTKNPYAFTVETLKVLFLNSAVADFSSKIDLQITQLFGEPASLRGSKSDIVQMFGVYQSQDVNGTQQDSYSFQTADGQISTFDMKSQVLNAVTITQGQFVTITSTSTSTETQSQFVFWGLLDFRSLKNFDIFSFGRDSGDGDPTVTAMGLNYANLAVDMDYFPNNPPTVPAVTNYTFDASRLTFDLAGSHIRQGGFYNHFPLTLAGFTQAQQGVTPADVGYMGVQSPLNQSNLSFPWFSMNFNLNLGTPGALAADVGFIASLTAAWSPNAGVDYRVFTGLQMPGSNGAKRQISIEGIFAINFKTLEIIAVPASNTYILVLYGIAFSFLSFNFPPSGQVNFVLFGNPNPTPGDTTLGWYAAYAKEGTKTDGGGKSSELLKASRIPAGLICGPESRN